MALAPTSWQSVVYTSDSFGVFTCMSTLDKSGLSERWMLIRLLHLFRLTESRVYLRICNVHVLSYEAASLNALLQQQQRGEIEQQTELS